MDEAELRDEKTIEEMQATIFDVKVYEYYNQSNKMFYID